MFHQFSGCKFHYPFNLFVCARARVHMLTTINNRQIVISFDKHQRQQQQQQQSSSYQMAQWQFSILICVKSNKSQMTGLKSICSTKRCAMWQSICTNETKFHNVCTSTSTATFNQTIRNQSQGWHRDDAIVIVLLCATSLLSSHSLSLIPCHVTAKQNENAFHSFWAARWKKCHLGKLLLSQRVACSAKDICVELVFVEDFTSTVTLEQLFMIYLNVKINENRIKKTTHTNINTVRERASERTDIENLVKLVECLIQSVSPCVLFTNHFHII